MAYIDDFGLDAQYGLDANGKSEAKNPSAAPNKYCVKQVVVEINGDELTTTATKLRNAFIAKGSVIFGCDLVGFTAAGTPATTVDIGTCEKDGTAIDADGLVDGGALGTGAATGAGALIGKQVAKDSYVSILTSSVAGAAGFKGVLVIDYI